MVLNNFIVDTTITWDRVGRSIFENPQAKPGRKLRVQVTNAGVIEDLTGSTLNLGWKNPSNGIEGLDIFTAVDITKGIFEIEYTEGMLSNYGNLKASLQLVNTAVDLLAESNDFVIRVSPSTVNPDASQSIGSWTAFAEILLNEDAREEAAADQAAAFATYDARIEQVEVGVVHPVTNIITSNSDFTTTDGLILNSATVAAANNILTITGTGGANNPNAGFNLLDIPTGNKVYMRVWARVLNAVCQKITLRSELTELTPTVANPVNGQWYELGVIRTKTGALGTALNMAMTHTYADSATANGKQMEVKWAFAANVTADFGAASEPTADYMNAMLKMYPDKYFTGTQNVYPLRSLAEDVANGYNVIDDKFDAFVQTNIVQTEVAAVFDNLEETYAQDIVSLGQQLAEANAQLDSFVVEQSSGMTDTGSLELVQTRVNTASMKFPVATRRIDYIEEILTHADINMIGTSDLIGMYPSAVSGWPTVDSGAVETLCSPSTANVYPYQRYRFNAKLNHKYLVTFKVKGTAVTDVKINVSTNFGGTSTSTPTELITGFVRTITKLVPFDYETLAATVTLTNGAYTSLDLLLSLTQPNLDTAWAYKEVMIIDVTGKTSEEIIAILNNGYHQYGVPSVNGAFIADFPTKTSDLTNDSGFLTAAQTPKFYGENILAIGDSLTAALQWQVKVAALQGCTVTTHAKGGIGLVDMVNGKDDLPALTPSQLIGKSSIILFGGMNERNTVYGVQGDLWPTNNTLYGKMQYVINKLYELLATAGNLTCQILIVVPHCPGKNDWLNANGYEEYPTGSGQTLELLVNHLKKCVQYNNLPVVDLWHDSGIGKNTWVVYAASATADNTAYTKYELDSNGNVIGVTPLVYVNGTSYYQMVGGVPTLVQYTGTAPHPYNRDQLHLNNTNGYPRIGEIISEALNRI